MSPTTEHNPWPPKSTQMASVPQPADNATTELSTQMASIPQPVDNATIKLGTREFCAFGVQNNINCVPVDDAEDDLFNTFHRYLSDHDILPTVPPKFLPKTDEPQVLDCGYGTGIWIEELLDMDAYTKSEVTGVDIFIRPRPGVQEFYKEQWNLNAPMQTKKFRLPSNHFDLINSRFLVDGVDERRWDLLVMEYKELLKPKAWLQMAEVEWIFHSQSNRHLPALEIWSGAYNSALAIMQKKPNVAADGWLEWLVRFKGFQQVNGSIHNIPIEEWRAENEHEEGSASVFRYVDSILSSLTFAPFTAALATLEDWSPERCRDVVQAAQTELRTRNADVFFKLTVVYGQKV